MSRWNRQTTITRNYGEWRAKLAAVVAASVLRFHEVRKNVVDPSEMSFSLGLKPVENARIETNAYGHFWPPDIAQPHHGRQLLPS